MDYSTGRYLVRGGTENVAASETAHNESVIQGYESELSAVFASLLKNDGFRTEFVNVLRGTAEYYSDKNSAEQIDIFAELMREEMKYYITCTWGGRGEVAITEKQWEQYVTSTLKRFFVQRGEYIEKLIEYYLS